MKSKPLTEAQFLTLLEKVLSRLLPDLKLRSSIASEISKEIRMHNELASFAKFCEKGSIPDIQPETVAELQSSLESNFGGEATVTVTPDPEGTGAAAVEITFPDRTISNQLKVNPAAARDDEPKAPFVPLPVVLQQDAELVWVLARREDLGPDEAVRALAAIEEEFWASKNGQKQLRDGADRTFAEFIANVPAAALLDSGLKRHYKEPEPIKTLKLLQGSSPEAERTEKAEQAGKSAPVAEVSDDPLSGIVEADAPPW